ncbi:ABC transporter substrate-binding protein [Roseicitreum antarcticum]|uniref:Multiple sugar transport system substrate-binding protein n=1 Tax=Roseicitreum antarcticum TaxID=564137 RepID=A0A1H2TT28_9RHOB|nr:extracellular solute-binding protein [Roseicitreum antarcticum]SDW47040.1 multiple sugar transport system substrate-binding protein [Roseicitreum antarcticum]
MKTGLKITLLATASALISTSLAADTLLWSTQAKPIEETQAMREQVLAGFDGEVSFEPADEGPWQTRLTAELTAGSGSIGALGALHGDFTGVSDGLSDLSAIDVSSVAPGFVELGKLGTDTQKYIPWMQATYIMAAHRQALEYLPEGADLMALSYDELVAWAANMHEATGEPRFGFPAGPQGLKHRFFQGYLLPSFTGSMVTEFRSDAAEDAWNSFLALWEHTNPASTNFSFMQEQLIAGDAWVVFDHTARLADAFNQQPDDFVAFPAPAGPAGRGFMPVLAGVAVPVTAPDPEEAAALVRYLLEPETQIATLRATNFFPVIDLDLPDDMPASVQAAGPAISAMSGADDALPALLPVGLGSLGGQFNQVYSDTFERIVLAGQPVRAVLDDQAEALRRVIDEAAAPCWAPDAASDGPCPVN